MAVGKLYMTDLSPPCRAVILTAKSLGIELELIETNIMAGETATPEFLKMNPAHALPTYKDNDGTAMGDSHAIMAFLVGKYGKNDSLYPKDLAKRAAVDQRLHYDSGNVYSLHVSIVFPMWMRQSEGISQRQLDSAKSMYNVLNTFLEGNTWIAKTASPTIADFSLATSVNAINVVAPMDKATCGNVVAWLKRCDGIPHYQEVNKKGQDLYTSTLKCMMNNDYSFMDKFA